MSIMDYISGEIVDKEPERIVVETGGIGFDLLILSLIHIYTSASARLSRPTN